MSCRATNGTSPGINALPPVKASRIGRDPGGPYTGPYEFCDYCTMVHKDAHCQSMYPLTPAQHQGAEMHRDSPVAYAGMPSALWAEGVQYGSQDQDERRPAYEERRPAYEERRPGYETEGVPQKDEASQYKQMSYAPPAKKGY